jgi:PBSX family phage terminase large subunit
VREDEQLWVQGIIAPWYLRDDQIPIYELLVKQKHPFIECSRRYGKTTAILTFVLERLIQKPNSSCVWCAPDKNQAREIIMEEVRKIQEDISEENKFHFSTTDSFYKYKNGSKIYLRGVNHDRGDSARGGASDMIVADEFGFWKDPSYIVRSALRPRLDTTNGPFIIASTPPEDLGHAYYEHKAKALALGRFIQRTIHDNKSYTQKRIDEICDEVGGPKSPSWLREYLCLPVSAPDKLVVPEFSNDHVIETYEMPPAFTPYVGIDLGLNDCTAMIFGFYDFEKATLVIQDEIIINGKNTKEITEAAKAKEAELWGGMKVIQRWSDNDMQQLYDMHSVYGYTANATRKDDKLAAINSLRLRFTNSKIKIFKKCKGLIFQLQVGIWNNNRTSFLRGETTGHLDAIDALIYLNRNVNERTNPFNPANGVNEYTHFIPDQYKQENIDKGTPTADEIGVGLLFGGI